MSFSNYFIGVPYAAKFEPYTLTETTVNLSWKVNASYNAPVINYQLEFQEIPHGQWITVNVPAKGQLISKCPFGVFKSPQKTNKFFYQDFCPIP